MGLGWCCGVVICYIKWIYGLVGLCVWWFLCFCLEGKLGVELVFGVVDGILGLVWGCVWCSGYFDCCSDVIIWLGCVCRCFCCGCVGVY